MNNTQEQERKQFYNGVESIKLEVTRNGNKYSFEQHGFLDNAEDTEKKIKQIISHLTQRLEFYILAPDIERNKHFGNEH